MYGTTCIFGANLTLFTLQVFGSDDSWKCFATGIVGSDGHGIPPPAGWKEPDFDDSGWQQAVMHSGPRSDAWGYGPDNSCNGCNNVWAHNTGHANEGISSRGRVWHYAPNPTERSCPKIHTILAIAEHVQMNISTR